MQDFDNAMMAKAIHLATKGTGYTSPNPLVGAVVVKDGRIIGEGFHRVHGGLHAEAEAIRATREDTSGATLYCNLEPCCHRSPGKHQPPCTDLIIASKIARVCIANIDPNPQVSGKGISILRSAGIQVEEGFLARRGEELNEIFFHNQKTSTPFVHLKMAQSLDGRIATATGDSRWISSIQARRQVHRLRAAYDAVLVGSGTVSADDPELSVRLCAGRDPLRIVLSSHLDISLDAKLLNGKKPLKLVAVRSDKDDALTNSREQILAGLGVRIIRVPGSDTGLDIRATLDGLYSLGIRSILVEGGARIFTAFIKAGLYQKISIYTAPILVGEGKQSINDLGTTSIEKAPRLSRVRYTRLGDQLRMQGYKEQDHVYRHS